MHTHLQDQKKNIDNLLDGLRKLIDRTPLENWADLRSLTTARLGSRVEGEGERYRAELKRAPTFFIRFVYPVGFNRRFPDFGIAQHEKFTPILRLLARLKPVKLFRLYVWSFIEHR